MRTSNGQLCISSARVRPLLDYPLTPSPLPMRAKCRSSVTASKRMACGSVACSQMVRAHRCSFSPPSACEGLTACTWFGFGFGFGFGL